MTYEEALKIIEECGLNVSTAKHDECMGKIKEAVEKQIPKKPCLDNENGVYEKEYCPTCYRSLFPNDHHCRCGQALDWSE